MCAAVNIYPIDPLRGPVVVAITDGDTWASQAWNNLTHRACTVYVSSNQAVSLFIDHAHSDASLTDAPISSQHSVAAYVPVSFHEKLDARISRIRVSNASGFEATVTLDVILRPTAEDHASTRLTMEGLDIGSDNPLPVSASISNAVEIAQWDAASLNATVTQAGTVNVASASTLDTRALTSATDSVTVTGTLLVNPGGLNLQATVFQDDPTELHATVVQAGPVTTQGSSILVKTVVITESSSVQFLVDLPCTLHGYSFTTTAGRAVVHYYDADSTDSVTTSTVPAFSIPVETNQTALAFGNGDHITFASGLAVRINDNYSYTGTTGPGTSSITVYYR